MLFLSTLEKNNASLNSRADYFIFDTKLFSTEQLLTKRNGSLKVMFEE